MKTEKYPFIKATKTLRIYYFICFLFLWNFVSKLIEERGNLSYRVSDENVKEERNLTKYRICWNLKAILKEMEPENAMTEIDLDDLNYRLISFFKGKREKFERLNDREKNVFNILINQLSERTFYVFKNLVCFAAERQDFFEFEKLLGTFEFYKTRKYIMFKEDTLCYMEMSFYNSRYNQFVIYKKTNSKVDFSNLKIYCLNRCAKRKKRLAKYLYFGTEQGPILLVYENNSTVSDIEIYCIENECNNSNDNDFKETNFMNSYTEEESIVILKAFSSLSEAKFFYQLAGLILLLINTSLNRLIFKLVLFMNLKFKTFKPTALRFLKIAILLIIVFISMVLNYQMIVNFLNKRDYPIRKEVFVNVIGTESFRLAICMDFKEYLEHEDHSNMTYFDIENLLNTRVWNETVVQLYLDVQDEKIKIEHHLSTKVIFKGYERCGQVNIGLYNF